MKVSWDVYTKPALQKVFRHEMDEGICFLSDPTLQVILHSIGSKLMKYTLIKGFLAHDHKGEINTP